MDQIAPPVAWRRRRWWLAAFAAAVAAAGVHAQQVFRTSTDAVVMTVTVTDSAGRLVAGLEQEDFQVFEDQLQQDITNFSRQPQPIALSLVIDTSASMENKLPIAQEAAMGFVRRMAADDRIQIIDFDSQAKILLDFSGDRDALERAIKRTEAGGSTSLYNAVYTAISGLKRIGQEAGPENRRYAVVLLSDGEDTSSIVPYDDVLDLAKRAGVLVYAIGLREKLKPGASHTTGWKQAEYDLKQLAGDTGGRVFFADDVAQLPSYYSQIADELSNQYTLGYMSKNSKRDGAWRKILVRMSRPNMIARTKAGYFGPAVPR
ncbi:MAG TPA: VWA domain-containing protein [Vicinamibacterales bacterium]|nr:VWA domain-containing protein [Vicinamibacterales bacterium]